MRIKSFVATALVGLLLSGTAMAEEGWFDQIFGRHKEVRPVDNKQYKDECGSCHFAYQPGLLPARSWELLLNEKALADHFGENAELDKAVLASIYDYTMANSADKSNYKRSRKIDLATEGVNPAPIRITEVRYIKRKHHEIPAKMIKDNKDVKSLSMCDTCHTKAAEGVFDSDTVKIPNFPNWDD